MKTLCIVIGCCAAGLLLAQRSAAAADDVREAPRMLKPGDHGVGRLISDAAFADLAGATRRITSLAAAKDTRAVAFVMTSTSCPISKKYVPTLAALVREFGPRGVSFVFVNPIASDERKDLATDAKSLGGIYVHDAAGALAKALSAATTTDVIVIDAARTVIYHGAIDDQYGLGYALDAPRRRYLAEALSAHLAGRAPLIAATTAPGCELDLPSDSAAPAAVTYHNRIARIVQQHCVECHRDGGVAPFALTSYEDVASHAGMIRRVIERGVMPPWFAAPGATDSKHAEPTESAAHASPWANDRSLAAAEKADLLAWIAAGKPRGDAADAPKPRAFTDGWLIGKPDAVFQFERAVPIKASGTMPYQNIIVETNLPADQWVQAIEIQPSAREVVHHVLVFIAGADKDEDESDDRDEDERRGFWAAYVPGNSAVIYPDGYAKKLPKGARLRFQMHYTPAGKATEDRTRIGVVFAKEPPRHEVHVYGIANGRIRIPPHAANHAEHADIRLPFDIEVLAFMPHMHVRGKACRYEITRGSNTTTALDIPRYDFNWQLRYQYFQPLKLSRGDAITFTAWYDNSDRNPANPDPSAEVRWGPQTFHEMHLGYIEYTVPGARPGEPLEAMGGKLAQQAAQRLIDATFTRLDADGDGKLTLDEARKLADNFPRLKRNPRQFDAGFRTLDADGNGTLNREEFAKIRDMLRLNR